MYKRYIVGNIGEDCLKYCPDKLQGITKDIVDLMNTHIFCIFFAQKPKKGHVVNEV